MFEVGKGAISLHDFYHERWIYGYSYPFKGDVWIVRDIGPHPDPEFLTLYFDECEIGLCSCCFAPVEERGETMIEEIVNWEPEISL